MYYFCRGVGLSLHGQREGCREQKRVKDSSRSNFQFNHWIILMNLLFGPIICPRPSRSFCAPSTRAAGASWAHRQQVWDGPPRETLSMPSSTMRLCQKECATQT